MKRWIIALLIPLTLNSTPALAQTARQNEAEQQQSTQPVVSEATSGQIILAPLPGTEQIQLQLVNCSGLLDCTLAHLLLPASAYIDQRQLQFDNPSAAPVNVLNNAVVAQGNLTGYQLTNAAVSITQDSLSLPANQIVSLPLRLNRSAIPPDQYNGKVYLTLANQGRLTLPLTLSMRSGPLVPLVVLLFGVILGRLFKYMQERGEPQAKVFKELNRLEADIAAAHPDDRALLSKMSAQAKQLVFREQLEAATERTNTIRNRLEVLNKLRDLETSLEQRIEPISDGEVNRAIEFIHSARQYIVQEEDAKAKELIDKVNAIIDTVGSRSAGSSELSKTARAVTANLERLEQNPQAVSDSAKQPMQFQLQRWLILLSGISDQVRTETTFWIVRPLLSLILLVGLSAVGIGSLYVKNGATFGANPFSDYLGLILWGLSADVASRSLNSLSSLPGSKE